MGKPRQWGGKGGSAPSSSKWEWRQHDSWGNRGYAGHGREIVVRVEPSEGGKRSRKKDKKDKKRRQSSSSSDSHSSSSSSEVQASFECEGAGAGAKESKGRGEPEGMTPKTKHLVLAQGRTRPTKASWVFWTVSCLQSPLLRSNSCSNSSIVKLLYAELRLRRCGGSWLSCSSNQTERG